MFKKILAGIGAVVLTGALGLGVACAVSEPVRNWTMDRLGIERVVEDENPEDELPGDETTGDENGDSTTGDETTAGTEDEGTTDVPTQPSTGEDESDIPTA